MIVFVHFVQLCVCFFKERLCRPPYLAIARSPAPGFIFKCCGYYTETWHCRLFISHPNNFCSVRCYIILCRSHKTIYLFKWIRPNLTPWNKSTNDKLKICQTIWGPVSGCIEELSKWPLTPRHLYFEGKCAYFFSFLCCCCPLCFTKHLYQMPY